MEAIARASYWPAAWYVCEATTEVVPVARLAVCPSPKSRNQSVTCQFSIAIFMYKPRSWVRLLLKDAESTLAEPATETVGLTATARSRSSRAEAPSIGGIATGV